MNVSNVAAEYPPPYLSVEDTKIDFSIYDEPETYDTVPFSGFSVMSENALNDLPDPEWLIDKEGLRIPARGLSMIFGASGAGKSLIAGHLALGLAQEQQVLYVAAEKVGLLKYRTQAWYQHYNLVSHGNLLINNGAIDLTNRDFVMRLAGECRANKVSLVVLDTVARCMLGLDENSAKDAGLFARGCETLMRVGECAVMGIHHTGWDEKAKHERGSSALRAACDCVIRLTATESKIILENVKQNGDAEFQPVEFKREKVQLENGREDIVPVFVGPVTGSVVKGDKPKKDLLPAAERKFLELLVKAEKGMTNAEFKVAGITGGSFTNSKNSLMIKGYVIQKEAGKPFEITDEGKQAIA